MARLSISRAWEETRTVIAREGRLLTTVALALILLPQAVAGALAPPKELSGQDAPSWMAIVAILVGITGIIGQIAVIRLSLGHGTSVGDSIAHGARRFLSPLAAVIILIFAAALLAVPLLLATAGPESLDGMARGAIPPASAALVLLLILALLAVGVRLQLIVPVSSEEGGGPFRLIKRSWQLTTGNYWRLFAFLMLVLVCALIVMIAAGVVGGLLARTMFGEIEPLSFGALILSLLTAAVQAAFSVVITVMLARIYVQLAGAAEPVTVPHSGI